MEPARETTELRTFAAVVFYLLLVFGIICIIVGALLAGGTISEFASVGWTAILSGALCIIGAFGLRILLRVMANMAEDLQASRELLSEIQQAKAVPPRAAPSVQAKATAGARSAPQRSGRIPMPPTRGTSNHPPMPPLRGSSDS